MKKLLLLLPLAFVISCKSSQDFKTRCEKLLSEKVMVEYYQPELIEEWKQGMKECNENTECLEASYEYFLDKYGEAKTEIEIRKMMQE